MLIIAILLLYAITSEFNFRYKTILSICAAVVLIILPFILNPPTYKQFKLDLNLYTSGQTQPKYLRPKTFARVSMSLHFYPLAARIAVLPLKKLSVIYKRNPQIPLYFVIIGKDSMM